jgi:hypothetical protein
MYTTSLMASLSLTRTLMSWSVVGILLRMIPEAPR